jgi:cytochrome c6
MLSTITLVVAGLSTSHKIGLAAVGAAFITFALISSFVLPKRIPDFPGRFIGWYIAIAVLFFLAMLSAVIVFGREAPEASAEGTTTSASAPPANGGAPATVGDPIAGSHVFLTAGCTGCHTLKAAHSTGTVGPNLDELKPTEATVQHQVETGGGAMPSFKGTLSPKQIQDVAAYVFVSTH